LASCRNTAVGSENVGTAGIAAAVLGRRSTLALAAAGGAVVLAGGVVGDVLTPATCRTREPPICNGFHSLSVSRRWAWDVGAREVGSTCKPGCGWRELVVA
jgi:hypothetical protein